MIFSSTFLICLLFFVIEFTRTASNHLIYKLYGLSWFYVYFCSFKYGFRIYDLYAQKDGLLIDAPCCSFEWHRFIGNQPNFVWELHNRIDTHELASIFANVIFLIQSDYICYRTPDHNYGNDVFVRTVKTWKNAWNKIDFNFWN